MRVSKECEICLRDLARQASELATADEALRRTAISGAEAIIKEKFAPGQIISIRIATPVHDHIKRHTANPDPYRAVKDVEIQAAHELFSAINGKYKKDNFVDMLKLAATGNAIDFFRPIEEVKREIADLRLEFTVDDSRKLEGKVRKARNILYLADNAGEVFFDLPLLKLMRNYARTVYVVKAAAVQNDITLEDIKRAGLQKEVGDIMTTGTATPGVLFELASDEFKQAFEAADFIFAKGMGYYETLGELPCSGRVFNCLKAKCQPVADSLGVPKGSYVAMLR
jgi:uncharacterized protein with ATP-grasp and redox domains